ncbi:Hypothetical predicted protein, partial [Olea europaea subsp. europaea]
MDSRSSSSTWLSSPVLLCCTRGARVYRSHVLSVPDVDTILASIESSDTGPILKA